MKKETYIVFTPTNARIVINPEDLSLYEGRDDVLKNPDLSQVQDTPPHFWKKQGTLVVPMNNAERVMRQKSIDENVSHFPVVNDLLLQIDHFKKVIESLHKELGGIEDEHMSERDYLGVLHLKSVEALRADHSLATAKLSAGFHQDITGWKRRLYISLPLVLGVGLYLGHFIK